MLVGVSGGLDSMVLLDVIYRLAPEQGWRIAVAHFNHQLRGRSSDGDEKFVGTLCKRLKLTFAAGRADVRQHAEEHGLSVEMAARELRHRFLAEEARSFGRARVALAHHANDQAELFFIRLFRGAGAEGLAGMKWESRSPADSEIRIVRPLLDLSKEELLAYARTEKIKFREDASNLDEDILRNKIRRKLIPQLAREYQPALLKVLLRQMEILGAEGECVNELAMKWLGKKRGGGFDDLAVAVQRRCLQIQLLKEGIVPGFDLIDRLRFEAGQRISIDPKRSVFRDEQGRVCVQESTTYAFGEEAARVEIGPKSGEIEFAGVKITHSLQKAPRGTYHAPKQRQNAECFDADRVGAEVVLRHWRAGDRFQPIGMPSAVKLQDLLVNMKVPRERRHGLVVAATSSGEIFWVEGLRIGDGFKVEKDTHTRLHWRWKRLC